MKDHKAAELYCYNITADEVWYGMVQLLRLQMANNSQFFLIPRRSTDHLTTQERSARQGLFMSLLRVYLVPDVGHEQFVDEAIALLNSHLSDLDVATVESM